MRSAKYVSLLLAISIVTWVQTRSRSEGLTRQPETVKGSPSELKAGTGGVLGADAGFVWPTSGWVIATHIYSGGAAHGGSVDIAAPFWTPVIAARGGTVVSTTTGEISVTIDHGNGVSTLYAHLLRAPSVSVGQSVATGQVIGYVGRSGNAPVPHLHFGIFRDGARQVIPGVQFWQWIRQGDLIPANYGLSAITKPGFTFTVKVTVDALELRTAPDLSHPVVGTVGKGTVLTVADSKDGFYEVRYDDGRRWVVTSGVEPTDSEMFDAKVTANQLAVRTGPGSEYTVDGSFSKDTLVSVLTTRNGWNEVYYRPSMPFKHDATAYGWIPSSGVTTTSTFQTAVQVQPTVPVRSGPGASFPVVGNLDVSGSFQNRLLTVHENRNGWYRVTFNGADGWIEGWKTSGRQGLFFTQERTSPLPYPHSSIIYSMAMDPERISLGWGDNWPITWGDDDILYTTYNDGSGFNSTKGFSMALAKILGYPPSISGENIPSPTGEIVYEGNEGPKGKKTCSMIMVDGILYSWVRNLNPDGTGSTVAWSADHAKTWTWASWGFPEIGYPVWLNYGKNNAGARDDYLYFYSPDTNSAYIVTDDIILGRVHKNRVRDKSAYQFFSGFGWGWDEPAWTSDFSARKPVFTSSGRCYRPEVVYNSEIGRYLLFTMTPKASFVRSAKYSHLGIFDAPYPWGPWTTALWTDEFAPLENRFQPRVPTKWISPDGTSFYLVYSCYPAEAGPYKFNVQKCTLRRGVRQTVSIRAMEAKASPGAPGRFLITRTGDLLTLPVRYTIGGTAINGRDYEAIGTSVTIGPGEGSTAMDILVVPKAEAATGESVVLTLAPDSTYDIGTPSSAKITIAKEARETESRR